MAKSILLIGPASEDLGADLAALLEWPSVSAHERVFPDGETCLDAVLPEGVAHCVIVQGTHPPQDRHLIQLLQLVQIARHHTCQRITCVVPYLAYSRQDRRTLPGEAITAHIVLDMLEAVGVSELVCVDVHNDAIFEHGTLTSTSLSAQPVLVRALEARQLLRPVLIASDAGGGRRLAGLARRLGWEMRVLDKIKSADGTTHYDALNFNLSGRDAVILDDLCSSGSTLVPLVARLTECGADRVVIGITHFFAKNEPGLLARLGRRVELIYTDTTARGRGRALRIAPEVAMHLRQMQMLGKVAE